MKRKILAQLIEWKNRRGKKPLLVYGARQVGKTYLIKNMFGAEHYQNICYVNFEYEQQAASAVFEGKLEPHRIVSDLALLKNMDINPEATLIVLDEAQLCEAAVTSLKYFAELAPEYDIIATGSLFGVAFHRKKHTFPVGKVEVLRMFPMDFEEYLWAKGEWRMAEAIRDRFSTFEPFFMHDEALRLYREYLLVGGMPEAVLKQTQRAGFQEVRSVHHALNATYASDVARYIGDANTARTLELWESIPRQLMKENKKFKLADVKKNARGFQYASAFSWLLAAGLIYKCPLTMDGEPPFLSPGEDDAFKTYLFDTGMLASALNIEPSAILLHGDEAESPDISPAARGALAENYVMQSLQANGIEPFYWRSKGSAEVDFLFQNTRARAVPVEVKSKDNVRSRSLSTFVAKYRPETSVRLSTKNFGRESGIASIPLYATFCIEPDFR